MIECRGRALLVVLLAALWAPGRARAYRPFDGTDAEVAAFGEQELELEPLGFSRGGRQRAFVLPAVVWNWGFAPRWEAVVEGRQLVAARGEGGARWRVEDVTLSVKHVLRAGSLGEGVGPSLATEWGALLPDVHGAAGAGGQGALVVSQAWPAGTVHLNLLGAWARTHVPAAFGSLIVEGPGRWTVRPVTEVSLEAERGARPLRALLGGVIWPASPALALDAAVRTWAQGAAEGVELRAGLSWTFSGGR